MGGVTRPVPDANMTDLPPYSSRMALNFSKIMSYASSQVMRSQALASPRFLGSRFIG